jgi:hypothetical protein
MFQRYYSRELTHYQSDIYTNIGAGYYPVMVWQFWGRAARRPELKSLGRFLFFHSTFYANNCRFSLQVRPTVEYRSLRPLMLPRI